MFPAQRTFSFTSMDVSLQWKKISSALCPCLCFFQHVIRGNRPIKTEMAHQLYVLQVLTFNLLEERMMTKMDPNDQVGVQWDRALLA